MRDGETKFLALDIDGTLTNSRKEISPATREAIRKLMVRGHKVILASGRPTPGLRRYERELELERLGGYLVSYNGALVSECRTGEILYQRAMPLTLLPGLYSFAGNEGCGLITYLGNDVISAFPPDKYVELTARNNDMPVRVVEDFPRFVDFSIHKCLMTAEPARAEELEQQLRKRYGSIASIYRSEPYFIEVMAPGVTKAIGLERLLEHLGRRRESLVCCGDGFNDIEMLRYAGVGVAMGNAQPVVKEAADYITGTNDQDGLVEVIENFFT